MSFTGLLIHSVTIYNPASGSTDRYGNETLTFDAGTAVDARVQPYLNLALRAREDYVDRDTRENWFLVFMLPDAPLTGLSEIGWNGHRMKIEGEPALVFDGDDAHHLQAIARETKG